MERSPDFVRPMVQRGIEVYAAKTGYQVITPTVVEESKSAMGGDVGGNAMDPSGTATVGKDSFLYLTLGPQRDRADGP